MTSIRWLTLLAVLSLASREYASNVHPGRPATTVIFVDVTSSLTPLQIENVIQVTNTIIRGLPSGTNFVLYAVQIDPHTKAFSQGQIPTSHNRRDRLAAERAMNKLQSDLRSVIFDLYCSINCNDKKAREECKNRHFIPRPQDDLRSCILGTLTHAATKLEDLTRAGKSPVEFIYVSDMIEECRRTPLDQMIRLTHADISSDIEDIHRFRNLPDLSAARVTIIVPRVIDAERQVESQFPAFDSLREYWRKIFASCKVKAENWRFSSEVPDDLQARQKRGQAR